MTPFDGFRHRVVTKFTFRIPQVGVHHYAHFIVVDAVDDDVNTCLVGQVDVVEFLTWEFLQT